MILVARYAPGNSASRRRAGAVLWRAVKADGLAHSRHWRVCHEPHEIPHPQLHTLIVRIIFRIIITLDVARVVFQVL